MEKYEVTIKREFTQEQIDNLIDGAFGSCGIYYWACIGDIDKTSMSKEDRINEKLCVSEIITRGGKIELLDVDFDDKESYGWLTLEKVLNGLKLYYQGEHPNNINEMEHMDGRDDDIVIQLAMFGEVVYG